METGLPISGVKVSVIMENEEQTEYGILVEDTVHKEVREKLILENGGNRGGWTYLFGGDNRLIRFDPLLTDSVGRFELMLHEGSSFGQPEFSVRFELNGFETLEVNGDWGAQNDMTVELKKRATTSTKPNACDRTSVSLSFVLRCLRMAKGRQFLTHYL